MSTSIDHLSDLQQLLGIELDEDLARYETLMKNTSTAEKVADGLCWFPLIVAETGYGMGDYPFLIVERTKGQGKPHQFQAGSVVSLFTEKYDDEAPVKGTVQYVDRDQLKVILYDNELPEWYDDGQIGIQLLFDMHTYKEMQIALQFTSEASRDRLAELREVLAGERKADFARLSHPLELPALNPSQNAAVNTILEANDVALVHGPPGTGKTTTLVEAIQQLAKRKRPILVCAPSNAAVDLLVERCAAKGLNAVRVGNVSRVDPQLLNHTLEHRLGDHSEAHLVKDLKRRAIEFRRMAGKYKRSFGPEERAQRKAMYKEARALSKEAVDIENNLVQDILRNADVVATTLVGSSTRPLRALTFDTLIIDEAAQALEPACWIAIRRANRVVLAGDPLQLPPTVKSDEAQRKGLGVTMIERLINTIPNVALLDVQYRMHEQIMGFSNARFYEGQLQADASVAQHLLPIAMNEPIEFIDTAGCGFEELQDDESKSLSNPEEANILQKHLDSLLNEGEPINDIGIISPYKAQVLLLREQIDTSQHTISVNTVDGFQGQERDVIYISMVRSNETATIGFLSDYRRMNVAMTRARKKLVIIGDSATFGGDQFYQEFLDYVEGIGAYRSAWEWIS